MEVQDNNAAPAERQEVFTNPAPRNLPNASTVLILGILSIVFCWWHLISFVSIILGIVSLILAQKELKLYHTNPSFYNLSSLNNVKTGRICAIIGLSISILVFIFMVLLIIGIFTTLPFWGMIE